MRTITDLTLMCSYTGGIVAAVLTLASILEVIC